MANTDIATPHVGTVLRDRYELVRHIARGGMGDVYEAQDRVLLRQVAVKVYRAASPENRARFDEEVRTLAGLSHPGLACVYDAGPHGDDAYVVLELIDGPPLSASIGPDRPMSPDRAARLGAEVAAALAYIHERGVVHRDVTPSNVLCGSDGHPRLVDFGIVRLLDSPRVTSTSVAVGTAAYMAPEQVQGHDVSPAADVYSLGLVLLEALTGRHEFVGSVQEVAMARLVRDPDTTTGVPDAWRPLLNEMTLRSPSARPAATQVEARLTGMLELPSPSATAEVPVGDPAHAITQVVALPTMVQPALAAPVDVAPARTRRPTPIWGLAAAALVAVAVALVLVAGHRSDPQGGPSVTAPSTTAPLDRGAGVVETTTPSTTATTIATTTTTNAAIIPPDLLHPGKAKKDKGAGPKG